MQHQCGQNAALVHTDKTERSVLLIKLQTNLWDLFAVLVKVKMLTRLTLTMEKYHAVLVWSISCYPIIGTRMQQWNCDECGAYIDKLICLFKLLSCIFEANISNYKFKEETFLLPATVAFMILHCNIAII